MIYPQATKRKTLAKALKKFGLRSPEAGQIRPFPVPESAPPVGRLRFAMTRLGGNCGSIRYGGAIEIEKGCDA